MQIKQRFSMPYWFGSVLHNLSQNGSTTTSNRSILFDYNSRSPEAPNRPLGSPLKSTSDQGVRISRTQSEQLPPIASSLQIDK